jgi:hypothetical protein
MLAEAENKFDVTAEVIAFKRAMAPRREALKRAYDDVKDHVSRAAEKIRADAAAGRQVVPEVEYSAIRDGRVSEETRAQIRRTGTAVIRGVFPASVASDWVAEVGA